VKLLLNSIHFSLSHRIQTSLQELVRQQIIWAEVNSIQGGLVLRQGPIPEKSRANQYHAYQNKFPFNAVYFLGLGD